MITMHTQAPQANNIYLDHAATTPMLEEVVQAMLPYMSARYANPSSIYPMASSVKSDLEKARRTIKAHLGGQEGALFFTSGGTEANNWAIRGTVEAHGIARIISSPLEHSSTLAAIASCQARNVTIHYLPVNSQGDIDYEALESLLKESPKTLVTLMHGNNEIGNRLDIARIGSLCRKYGAIFHSDMVQTIGYYPIALNEWGVHLCTGSAHKFYGPKGIGFLYTNIEPPIAPFLYGGNQERGLRAGTENVAGIIGMAHALDYMHYRKEKHRRHIENLKNYAIKKIKQKLPYIQFHGRCDDPKQSLCNILNLGIPNCDQETFVLQLAMQGIYASSGSACMSGTHRESHVLRALGKKKKGAILRLSFGIHNRYEEIDTLINVLSK